MKPFIFKKLDPSQEIKADTLLYTQADLDQAVSKAERKSFQTGYDQALHEYDDKYAKETAELVNTFRTQSEEIKENLHNKWLDVLSKLHHIFLMSFEKLFPFFLKKYGMQEIQAVFDLCVAHLSNDEKLEVVLPPVAYNRMKKVATRDGSFLKIDSSMANNTLKIKWKNGGYTLDYQKIYHQILTNLQAIDSGILSPLEYNGTIPPQENQGYHESILPQENQEYHGSVLPQENQEYHESVLPQEDLGYHESVFSQENQEHNESILPQIADQEEQQNYTNHQQ